MVSFTAHRSFCLQPKYRSLVWIETWPSMLRGREVEERDDRAHRPSPW